MFLLTESSLKTSLGAILFGGLVCAGLSGIVGMQTILYFRLFSRDSTSTKVKVAVVFVLDFLHSIMIAAANYMYFVSHFGEDDVTDQVFWTIGVSIALTAVITVCVHLFFSMRLFKLSKGNYWITAPITILAVARVVAAFVTAVELQVCRAIRLKSFSEFGLRFRSVFTLGLVLSSVVDVLITAGLCYFLRRHRGGTGRFDHILNAVTLYTIENGLLTCVTTLISLIFWLVKPDELIYLGLHFAISKLYANSFLASMNARKGLLAQSQSQSTSGHRLPVIFPSTQHGLGARSNAEQLDLGAGTRVHITVDKTVDYTPDIHDTASSERLSTDQKGVGMSHS
ncbi:uncharacterized protein TRAVEDRAFT_41537 [Trametes versicolor FP-101664 SS1]|uniref:uncharacterized protein n=1 Tax=Trametes versicolor (strain FP-101664) TaxID=717944 RepID=UPI00046234DA|nr:uncharacterized protein TRAVEDRAFT_41537 [Trametes versicolor FP-101664 SS1]EIW64122.1 hypothetical protein TRAVEDRAFT_41537 [Trametes versicolor FP-101664 SS1]